LLNLLKRYRKLLVAITRRDWSEYRYAIAIVTVALFVPIATLLNGTDRPDFARGLAGSLVLCAAFVYAQSSFANERLRGTLGLLLSLPVGPFELVLAKFLSLYSMVLVTVNVPVILLRDAHLLLLANGAALLLSTLFLASTVISSSPVAPQIPLLFLIVATLPVKEYLQPHPTALAIFQWLTTHPSQVAVAAIAISPVIAISTAFVFKRQQSA